MSKLSHLTAVSCACTPVNLSSLRCTIGGSATRNPRTVIHWGVFCVCVRRFSREKVHAYQQKTACACAIRDRNVVSGARKLLRACLCVCMNERGTDMKEYTKRRESRDRFTCVCVCMLCVCWVCICVLRKGVSAASKYTNVRMCLYYDICRFCIYLRLFF